MSWWTDFRDGLETAAALVANYYYPGSGMLAQFINSKGSQEQLGSTLGQVAMLGTGVAGGAAGNFDNYGSTLSALGGSAAGAEGEAGISGTSTFGGSAAGSDFGGSTGAGVSGVGTAGSADGGISPQAYSKAMQMMQDGASPASAVQAAGISPMQAELAGLPSGAGQTWQDISANQGISYAGNSDQIPAQLAGTGPAGGGGGGTVPPTGQIAPGSAGLIGGPQAASAYGTGMPTNAVSGVGSAPWGSLSNLSTMGSGLYGLMQAQQQRNLANQAGRDADPFGQYRGQYAQQMSALAADPSLLTKQPGYGAGLQAVQRAMAAQGYTGSGNMMSALAKYGGDFYNQTMNNYANWGGAGFNPASAAQLRLQGNQQATTLAGQSLASLGYGVRQAGG